MGGMKDWDPTKRLVFGAGIFLCLFGAAFGSVFLFVVSLLVILAPFLMTSSVERQRRLLDYRPPVRDELTGNPHLAAPTTPPQPIVQDQAGQPVPGPSTDPDWEFCPLSPWKFEPGPFDVVLLSPGPGQDKVVRWIAAAFGITHEAAAALAAKRMNVIKTGVSGANAAQLETALERLGANVDVAKRHVVSPEPQIVQDPYQPDPSQPVTVQSIPAASTPGHRQYQTAAHKSALVDLVLISGGAKPIEVRKALKQHLGMELLEAYNAVEHPPAVLKTAIKRTEAERLKTAIETAGAELELRPA